MLKQLKDKKAKLQINAHRTPVVLYDDGDGIKHSFTDKLPITNFPLKKTDGVYEFPMEDPPYGLYTAGVDP
jgi:hypothetical protein